MPSTVARNVFRPNAVYLPVREGREGIDFDRNDCTLLFVDGEYQYGEVYTEEAWKNEGAPSYIQRCGDFFLPDEADIPVGRVQLLPDPCIVKLPEREYWSDDVRKATKGLFGVYALDRRHHAHLCELCASYELHFIETQYEAVENIAADEAARDELHQVVLEGDRQTQPVSYMHRKDIDPMFLLGRRCRPGWLPQGEQGGGYRLRGLGAVTWDGVLEAVFELRCDSEL